MTESLLHAYLPLFFWAGVGAFLVRFVPEKLPRLLGRSLYWVGIPIEIFALARQTEWSTEVKLAPLLTICAVLMGLGLAWAALQGMLKLSSSVAASAEQLEEAWSARLPQSDSSTRAASLIDPLTLIQTTNVAQPAGLPQAAALTNYSSGWHDCWQDRAHQGSFILAATIGNTGFIGLAVAPVFVGEPYLGWLVLYSVTQNLVGTYGMGVFLASYFGRTADSSDIANGLAKNHWWVQVRDVVTVPSLWAFIIGSLSQAVVLPEVAETGLRASIWVVIPTALLLMGMRLSQLRGWQSLRMGIIPSLLKVMIVPGLVGLLATQFQLPADARLAIVLMAGMPTAFAGLILAEEYELDREIIASSIVLTTGLLVFTIPLWLMIFGQH